MDDAILTFLSEEGIDSQLIEGVKAFRKKHNADEELQTRIPSPELFYYGKDVWKKALAALLAGENLLLAGPKATGKNVLAENLCAVFARPLWHVSFHINADAAYLIGTATFNGEKVVFRPRALGSRALAVISQYSSGMKSSISCSRSTTSLVATDCTRPALRPFFTFAHSSGLIL